MRTSVKPKELVVREGVVGPDMAYLRTGAGAPLLYLPGLSGDHRAPRGSDRGFVLRGIRPFAAVRDVWWVNRRPGLEPGVTMADLARDYAKAVRAELDPPVDVLGVSTGGSVALQLAADHPALVRRLVLVCSACRLGPEGREGQRRVADLAGRGKLRRGGGLMMSMAGRGPVSRRLLWPLGWAMGPSLLGHGDPDLLRTIEAEDAFDLRERLPRVEVPTLLVGGDRDRFYTGGVFEETARLLPNGRLLIYEGKGHAGVLMSRRLAGDVIAFLDAPA